MIVYGHVKSKKHLRKNCHGDIRLITQLQAEPNSENAVYHWNFKLVPKFDFDDGHDAKESFNSGIGYREISKG